MKAHLHFLDREELERIHGASLNILARTGMRIKSAKARDLLYEAGAEVAGDIVKLPYAMVESALKMVKENMTLGARESRRKIVPYDLPLPIIATSGYSSFTLDWRTEKTRNSLARDLEEFALVADYYDEAGFFWPIVNPTDIHPLMQELSALYISFLHTGKHIQCSTSSLKSARWQLRLAEVLAGGSRALKENPIFSCCIAPISPLTLGGSEADSIVFLAERGIPISPFPTPLSGVTAPAAIAGTLALSNAENLGILTLIKASNPNGHMIYSTDTCAADLYTGAINYQAPEYNLFSLGHQALARLYRLPSSVAHDCSEEMPFDLPSWEMGRLRIIANLMSGTDLSAWLGSKDSSLTASLTDMVVGVAMIREAAPFIEAKAYTGGADFIAAQVDGPKMVDWEAEYGRERKNGSGFCAVYDKTHILAACRQEIEKILAVHRPKPIAAPLLAEMDTMMAHARRELEGG